MNVRELVAFLVSFLGAFALSAVAALAQGSEPRWIVDPREREVGEPFEVALLVSLATGERLELDAAALEVDPSWVLAVAPRRGSVPTASDEPGGVLLTWSLASLEAGERDVPAPALSRVDSAGRRTPLALTPAKLRFTSALAQGEDDARPALGFRPLEDSLAEGSSPWLIAGCGALLLGVVTWWIARRRARPASAAPPTALERLAQLEARPVETREAARETYYELVELVRSHLDARSGVARAALTDREWLAASAEQVGAELAAELEALVRAAEPVKYAAHHPTHWAVREALERARKVLSALDAAPRRAA